MPKPDAEEREGKPAEATEVNAGSDAASVDEPVVESAAAEPAGASEEASEAAEQPKEPEAAESE